MVFIQHVVQGIIGTSALLAPAGLQCKKNLNDLNANTASKLGGSDSG